VAFADFMTAMMAFFLCMWLLNQSEEVKKEISDYFSTPSVIEYNFSNYGVELTLEKLFLDLINEPLKILKDFITPADFTPNFLSMGSKNIVTQHLIEQLGDAASNVKVDSDEIVIEIPDRVLFKQGGVTTSARFIPVMERVRQIAAGLEDATIYTDVVVDPDNFAGGQPEALKVGEQRLDIISSKIESALEHPSVDLLGRTLAERHKDKGEKPEGKIIIRMKQKEQTSDGRKPRKLDEAFGDKVEDGDVYDSFVQQVINRKTK
ncbi:MAG: chemotaxis protein MotB, partial [Bdellovibrionales bacterium]|nr:chemotaxis protein MotB [Bdellovibrionales bacterium]